MNSFSIPTVIKAIESDIAEAVGLVRRFPEDARYYAGAITAYRNVIKYLEDVAR